MFAYATAVHEAGHALGLSKFDYSNSRKIEGSESVLFLAPMEAHNAIAVEAWQAVAQWDLQTGSELVRPGPLEEHGHCGQPREA